MPQFKVCAHTCAHAETRVSRPVSERGYIIWSEGGAYTNHKNSKTLHSQCAPPCNPQGGFVDVSEILWARYANHVYDAHSALDEEGKRSRLWPKQERAIPKKFLTKSRGGLLDVIPEGSPEASPVPPLDVMDWTQEPSPGASAGPPLDAMDWMAGPFPEASAGPSRSRLSTPAHSATHSATRSPSPLSLEEPIWENILEQSTTDCYQDFMSIVYIENVENRMVSRDAAMEMLTFTVPPMDLDNERLREYKAAFPQLVFPHAKAAERIWFEWVSLNLFIYSVRCLVLSS